MDTSRFSWRKIGLAAVLAGAMASSALGEAMLQYFNTSWKEITDRMPELAEAGLRARLGAAQQARANWRKQ